MSPDPRKECGQRLRSLREQAGWSQDYLAVQVGVTQPAIHRWERGDAEPKLDKRLLLAELLGEDPYAVVSPAEQAS